jgi:hypothetical protein
MIESTAHAVSRRESLSSGVFCDMTSEAVHACETTHVSASRREQVHPLHAVKETCLLRPACNICSMGDEGEEIEL